jgi:hypothetical protein
MFFIVVLSVICISVVFDRINMAKKWRDSMERGSIGESKKSTQWPCTLAEGERAIDGESMVPFLSFVFAML